MNYKFSLFLASFVAMLNICLEARAQEASLKKFNTLQLAKTGKSWISVQTEFEYHEQYPELQEFICKRLFKEENTSISAAFDNYLKSFEKVKDYDKNVNTNGEIESYKIDYVDGKEGYYYNYFVSYIKKRIQEGYYGLPTRSLSRNFIFDVKNNKVLTLDDVFVPSKAEELKALIGKSTPQMEMDENSVYIGYKIDGKEKILNYSYSTYENFFTDSFKEIVPSFHAILIKNDLKKAVSVINNQIKAFRIFTISESDTKVFDVVEQMPSFKGGNAALIDYLSKNVHYPVVAEENGIQGRVVTTFVVERDGSITDVKVIKSVDPSLDKEAVRVVRSMPKWNYGKQNGEPVRVQFTLPITFRLDSSDKKKMNFIPFTK